MAELVWNDSTKKLYESGIDQGVLYVRLTDGTYPLGVAWNGLISVTETPEGAEPSDLYANNAKYATLMSAETFGGSLEAYTYPDEFAVCDGSVEPEVGVTIRQQTRTPFGFTYRTRIGSDAAGDELGHKIHILYGCRATPSEASFSTINESPEAITFSWDFTTTPVDSGVTDTNPTSVVVIDTTKVSAGFLSWLEDELYGTAVADPNLPLPDEIITQAGVL